MIDLRSDTMTKATPHMLQALADLTRADMGDDVYAEVCCSFLGMRVVHACMHACMPAVPLPAAELAPLKLHLPRESTRRRCFAACESLCAWWCGPCAGPDSE